MLNNKKLLLVIFVIVALIQISVPGKMVFDHENILLTGQAYKFKMQIVDPIDPFRGNYLVLNYANDSIYVDNPKDWSRNDEIYALLTVGKDGFATIKSVTKVMPKSYIAFVKTTVQYVYKNNLQVNYPFNKYYISETKSGEAQKIIDRYIQKEKKPGYVIISLKDGEAVIKDLIIDGISLEKRL